MFDAIRFRHRPGSGSRSKAAAGDGPISQAPDAIGEPPAANAGQAADPVAIATGILSALLGIIFLGFPSVFRGGRATHLSLAVMGCGLVAMGLNWRVAARWLAVVPGVMSLVTFIGYISFGPPGLDTIIMQAIWPRLTKTWGGDLNADLAYPLTAIAVFLLTKPGWKFRGRSTAIVLAASGVIGLGFVDLAGYVTGLRTAYGLRRLIEATADSIIGVLILGAGLLAITWRKSRPIPAERHAWILVVIAMSGFVVSTSLGQALMLIQQLPIESIQEFRSYLARTVLTFGLFATAVLAVAVSLILKFRTLNEELEKSVQQQTARLQAANQELEAFCYSVSHDLRAPLRAINGFSQILLQEHSAELSAEARQHLQRVSQGGVYLGRLIDSLLSFARLGQQEIHTKDIRMEDVVALALEDVKAERSGRRIEIVIGTLPPCQADPVLLRQVFVNLLSNAIKFTLPRELARIEVGTLGPEEVRMRDPAPSQPATVRAKAPVYYVRDNGVGFDMRYADRLFGVFQRLHKKQEFEGTGVGLATVRRIVQRHGGSVWAEAALDQGATFYLTLPARADTNQPADADREEQSPAQAIERASANAAAHLVEGGTRRLETRVS